MGIREAAPFAATIPTSWGTVASVVATYLERIDAGGVYTDLSSTALSGSNSYASNVITTKIVDASTLAINRDYRLGIKFTIGSQTLEVYCIIKVKK